MTRGAKFILGLTVALITAAGLQYTVGDRFEENGFRNFGHPGCGWHKTKKHHNEVIPQTPANEPSQEIR